MRNPQNELEMARLLTLDSIKYTRIDQSAIHGLGLFAEREFPIDTTLCTLDGQVISKTDYKKIEDQIGPATGPLNKYLFMECNYLDEDNILARTFRTKYSYINHSPKPNVEVRYHPMRIVVIKPINIGDELTTDYRREPLTSEYLSRPNKQFLLDE